jgi:hypothetical protein
MSSQRAAEKKKKQTTIWAIKAVVARIPETATGSLVIFERMLIAEVSGKLRRMPGRMTRWHT